MQFDHVFFMNIGEMAAYKGLKDDTISGGGRYVEERRFGGEIYNFQAHQGRCYGYGRAANHSIALERLGAPKGSDHLDNVLVVWVAKSHVVGWYKHARLFRQCQGAPAGSQRTFAGEKMGYYATAKSSDCKCLDPDARTLRVPRARDVDGGMGRYVWYAEGKEHKPFVKRLFSFIDSGGKGSPKKKNGGGGGGWQLDPRKRKKIEQAAIRETMRYFTDMGYTIRDRQNEHVGWDLEATRDGRLLRLEVKGIAGSALSCELSRNEYAHMKKHRTEYRVCVVRNALEDKRLLSVYRYVPERKQWIDQNDSPLVVEPIRVEVARLYERRR